MSQPWVVVKFGGTSVSDLASWNNIKTILQQHIQNNRRVVLVCSAPHKVSDYLLALSKKVLAGNNSAEDLSAIKGIYQTLCQELAIDDALFMRQHWSSFEAFLSDTPHQKHVSVKTQAQVMAYGELLLTQLACDYLKSQAINTEWIDARSCLHALEHEDDSETNHYLNAKCEHQFDAELVDRFNAIRADVLITQGFIARNAADDVVLLGRGGSDISAAYFSTKLQAHCCEIWTDVPGIYTANPHRVPDARQVTQLSHEEAREIALMGAEVLHPRTLTPLLDHLIPLSVLYTKQPNRHGTKIIPNLDNPPSIKSISVNHHVILLSLEALTMWQQSGFLANIFSCFKRHDISIDLISTSQANVTLSLDASITSLNPKLLDNLVEDLQTFAQVEVITPCASVSVVGCKIRKLLHQLGELFNIFRTLPVHMVSQAANDLSFTVVVDQQHADRVEQLIHELLIENSVSHDCFGLSYHHEFSSTTSSYDDWWRHRLDDLLVSATDNTPLYLYDKATLVKQATELLNCEALDRVFYSMKANSNKKILNTFYQLGLNFECVSIFEVQELFSNFPDIDPKRILFTPNFAGREEYEQALSLGIYVTIDNLHPLIFWPECFKGQSILLRIDPGFGKGHHQFVETGGSHSKFGIAAADFDSVRQAIAACDAHVIGLHAHSGSGIVDLNNWAQLANTLFDLCRLFPDVKIIDLGGGLGVPEKAGQLPLNLSELDDVLMPVKTAHPDIELWMEPGRFLTSEAGVLLAKVTQVKQKASLTYIGVDAGMHTLIRPALYGAYHRIINLSRLGEPCHQLVHIVGPICESGDILGRARWMPDTSEGDVILIANVGAYGSSMSSCYNLRPLAEEELLV